MASVAPPAPALTIHRLDVDTYDRMVASGALAGEPVELLEGLLVETVSPQSPYHAAVIERLTRYLAGAQARLRTQLPLAIPPDSEPEPDLALVAEEPSPDRHPRTALLVVEVSFSSPQVDRGVKAELYARAGVPTYWLVDVRGRAVEVHSDPGPGPNGDGDGNGDGNGDGDGDGDGYGYRRHEVYGLGATVPSPDPGVGDLDVTALFAGLS